MVIFVCICYAECHFAVCRYAECHYAEYHYAECRGAFHVMNCNNSDYTYLSHEQTLGQNL